MPRDETTAELLPIDALLEQAARLVMIYRVHGTEFFDVARVPLEFRSEVYEHLSDLLEYVESEEAPKDAETTAHVTNAIQRVQELAAGDVDVEARGRYRLLAYDSVSRHLRDVLAQERGVEGAGSLRHVGLKTAIESAEEALSWFEGASLANGLIAPKDLAALVARARAVASASSAAAEAEHDACAHCGRKRDEGALFCDECGAPFAQGKERNRPGAAYCGKCGGKLS